MSLFPDAGNDSRTAAQRAAEALHRCGALADRAAGRAAGFSERAARIAASIGASAGAPPERIAALYYAALLHGVGLLGNATLEAHDHTPPRALAAALLDVPGVGARACAAIAALPPGTADAVRWQNESWDGCGSPDGLRWSGVPDDAQYLQLALVAANAESADDAFAAIVEQSGRRFAPQSVRTFASWFALTGGDASDTSVPELRDASEADVTSALALAAEAGA